MRPEPMARHTMEWRPLPIEGAGEIFPAPIRDSRGYFLRTYDEAWFHKQGLHREWVQENQSLTREKHSVRGLHFQSPPHSETKLIRAARGRALDVLVDLRRDSATFREWCSVELSEETMNMVFATSS